MAISDRIQAMYTHTSDIYDSVELTGVDTTDIDKNLVNVPNTLKEGYIDILNNGTDTLYNNFPKVSGEGTSLTLNNTYQAPMRNNLKGNTSQTGTPTPTNPIPVNVVSGDNEIDISGSNLFDISTITQNTYINSQGGTGTSSVTNLSDYVSVESNTKYLFSYEYTTLLNSTSRNIVYYNASKEYLTGNAYTTTDKSRILTTPNNAKYLRFSYDKNCTNIKVADLDTYNIDLPVENLFDKNSPNLVNGYLGGNGSITTNNSYRVSDYMYIGNYEKITISGNNENGLVYCFYKEDKTFNGANAINGTSKTITPPTDTAYIRVTVKANNLDNYMVEKGSKANTYTPYGTTPIELCKIGNYQDYFYKDSGKWYLHKEIGKYIYNNVGSVNTPKTNYYNISGLTNQGWINTADTNTYLSTEYPSVSVQASDGSFQAITANMDYAFGLHLNGTTIRFKDNRGLSASDFKNDLVGTEIYFALATPTNTEITDTTLINQLEELYIAKSKENQTNISQINNDLGFIISASALKKGV